LAGRLSRRLGLGEGAIIGGRVTQFLDPGALSRLATGRRVVLVSGTNGKTTVAHLLAAALRTLGPVAHNDTGANMVDGALAALMARPDARLAVLEVDELHLFKVAVQVRPAAVVLLNLTRDQLDRSTEVAAVAAAMRRALEAHPQATIIANGDDPMIVTVADGLPRLQWVPGGANWLGDAALCPRCGRPLHREIGDWSCPACGLRRPDMDWLLTDGVLHGPGSATPLLVRLPGEYNRRNAVIAVTAAASLGVPPARAAAAVAEVRSVAHRYAAIQHDRQQLTLLLAKNPAGWREILPLLHNADGLLLAINASEADGRDTSWLWDIPFEQLPGRPTVASGAAAADLALRLAYADIAHDMVADPLQGLRLLPPGEITVVANYTAFTQLWHHLDRTARP
jgi:UDP-N-acetylmuramyl tripeptide synthase